MNRIVLGIALLCVSLSSAWGSTAEHSPENALLIGDSHTDGTFGRSLDALLRKKYDRVATYAFGGSIPDWYLEGTRSPWGSSMRGWDGIEVRSDKINTPRIDALLNEHHPNHVIVALGTNFLRTGDPETSATRLAEKILESGARCSWVGPPTEGVEYQERITRFDHALKKGLEKTRCQYISSFQYAAYPDGLGDGIHYDTAGEIGIRKAIAWAEGILLAITQD